MWCWQALQQNKNMLSKQTKAAVVCASDAAVVLFCLAPVFLHWDSNYLKHFVMRHDHAPFIALLLCLATLFVRLSIAPRKCGSWKSAVTPTVSEARQMKVWTALTDYFLVAMLFWFWSTTHSTRGDICPFSVAFSFFASVIVFPLKDDIQCRIVWKKIVCQKKLQWKKFSLNFVVFGVCALLGLVFSGAADFEQVSNMFVLARIWCEAISSTILCDAIGMNLLHRWMHQFPKLYFLHKKHHEAVHDTSIMLAYNFDIADLAVEFGSGIPLLIAIKHLLGFQPKIHVLSFHLISIIAVQGHAMNPYALAWFNPVLDHFARCTVAHNLHHVIKKGYYTNFPYHHLFRPSKRKRDISLYNEHMKTGFPVCV